MSRAREETMTVEELIEKLKQLDPKMPVVTEGCDCDGSVQSVQIVEYNFRGMEKVAYLSREKGE